MGENIWRRSNMTTAIVGLVGVIIGSVLTALLNFYLQREADNRRWKREDEKQRQVWHREDRTRFHAERLRLYRDFLVEARRVYELERLAEERMDQMAMEISLISSAKVSNLAYTLLMAVEKGYRLSHEKDAEPNLGVAMDTYWRLRDDFSSAARAELGTLKSVPDDDRN
jgi:hypothetical protein